MTDLTITHKPGRGNRITKANRRQIYKYLADRDPHEIERVAIRVVGRMQDHKSRDALALLSEELNHELNSRDSLWRVKALKVCYTRQGEFNVPELYNKNTKWPKQFTKTGWVEIVFGAVGVADL